jgi:hypothetical protein
MVKLVGAVRNFRENIKHVQIDVEDGTGLVRVMLWRKEKECTSQHQMIHECNSNRYIRVIGLVEDYYGVHKTIAFDVRPVSSGNKVTHHFLEVAYSFEKTLEYAEDEMLRAVLLNIFFLQIIKLMYYFLMFIVGIYLLPFYHSLPIKYSIDRWT